MNFCGGSWYGVFVVNITGIEGCMAVEEVAAMFVWSESSQVASLVKKKPLRGHRAGIPSGFIEQGKTFDSVCEGMIMYCKIDANNKWQNIANRQI